jgi:hypothetical protein
MKMDVIGRHRGRHLRGLNDVLKTGGILRGFEGNRTSYCYELDI